MKIFAWIMATTFLIAAGVCLLRMERRCHEQAKFEHMRHPKRLANTMWFDIHLEPQFPKPPDPRPIDPKTGLPIS